MINSEKMKLSLKNVSGNKLSEQEIALRSKATFKVWTYADVTDFIEVNFEDSTIKEELIKIAKKYPHSAYPSFIKNIQKTVGILLKKRSESINNNFKDKNKNKIIEKNMQDIKPNISIEEEIQLELNKQQELPLQEDVKPVSQQDLEKEFN